MATSAKTLNLQRWRQKVLERFPKAARAEMLKANDQSAREFYRLVKRSLLGTGDEKAPELDQTMVLQDGDPAYGGIGVLVRIGGPDAPYPLHLEAGHRARDGTHVPAKPFWNPAKSVVKKKHKARAARALRNAVNLTVKG